MANRGTIKAVLDTDLDQYLASLNCLDAVESGTARCAFCDTPITKAYLYAVFPSDGQVCFCCSRQQCRADLAAFGRVIC